MNKYEQQGQRLYSQNWSKEYKENYEKIFGVKYKFFYSDGSQKVLQFSSLEEANWTINMEGDHLIEYIKL